MGAAAKLTDKFQITIPAAVRRALSLQKGDSVVLDVEGDHAVLRPVRAGWAAHMRGLGADVWAAAGGSDAIERARDEWDRP